MHFLRSSAIESWNQPRLKINSLTFYKMNFHTQNVSKKHFFIEWGCVPIRARASAKRLPPIQMKKKSFLETFKCENSFCKKSRNLSSVGSDFSLKCLNFPKNAWNFALFEIWSGWRCDMKIIFGVFDHLDIKLLSNKIFYSWHGWIIWFLKCILSIIFEDHWLRVRDVSRLCTVL